MILGCKGDDVTCQDDIIVLQGNSIGAVLDKFVQMEIFGHFHRLTGFSAEVFPRLAEDIGNHPVVVDGKIKGTVGISVADVCCRRQFIVESNAHIDVVAVLGEDDLLEIRLGQVLAVDDKNTGDLHTAFNGAQIGLVEIVQDAAGIPSRDYPI